MPQASDEQRAEWGTDGGCGDEKATTFLQSCGWTLTHSWEWRKPSPDHIVTDDEWGAIEFMIDEWYYGGIAK